MRVAGPVRPLPVGPPPPISVVIAHLNQPDELAVCLDDLMQGRVLPDEVIVVDNGSARLPDAICSRYPLVRLLTERIPGPGPARTTGALAAMGEVIAFTDADCRPTAGWVEAVAAGFAGPDVVIVGGDVVVSVADPTRPTMAEAYECLFSFRADRYIRRHGFALTCNLAVRASVLRAVGGFAGRDLAEDVDWGRRARALGYPILFCPDMVVIHPARPSIAALMRKWDRQTAHAYAALGPLPVSRMIWALRGLAMFPSPLAELPRILLSSRIRGLRARAMAFAGLCLVRAHRGRVMLRLWAGGDAAGLVSRWNRPKGQG